MTDRWRVSANLATLSNAVLGVAAVLYVLAGNKLWAMLLIVCAIGFDGLDGIFSRRSASPPSRFGRIADSVADAVSFGVAPAFLIAVHTGDVSTWQPWEPVAIALAAAYLVAAVARLTSFTVRAFDRPYFLGIPTPQSALALVVALLFHDTPAFQSVQPIGLFVGVAVLSVMMVVPVRYPETQTREPAPPSDGSDRHRRRDRPRAAPVPTLGGLAPLQPDLRGRRRVPHRSGELLSPRTVHGSPGARGRSFETMTRSPRELAPRIITGKRCCSKRASSSAASSTSTSASPSRIGPAGRCRERSRRPVGLQPFVRQVTVRIQPDRGGPLGRGRFAYRYLTPEMLDVQSRLRQRPNRASRRASNTAPTFGIR